MNRLTLILAAFLTISAARANTVIECSTDYNGGVDKHGLKIEYRVETAQPCIGDCPKEQDKPGELRRTNQLEKKVFVDQFGKEVYEIVSEVKTTNAVTLNPAYRLAPVTKYFVTSEINRSAYPTLTAVAPPVYTKTEEYAGLLESVYLPEGRIIAPCKKVTTASKPEDL